MTFSSQPEKEHHPLITSVNIKNSSENLTPTAPSVLQITLPLQCPNGSIVMRISVPISQVSLTRTFAPGHLAVTQSEASSPIAQLLHSRVLKECGEPNEERKGQTANIGSQLPIRQSPELDRSDNTQVNQH